MTRQCYNLAHAGISPNHNLVQRISMRADNLVAILGPSQIANLTSSIDATQAGSTQSVPESNASIRCSSSTGQEPVLVWRPGNGLDGGRVIRESLHGLAGVAAVHHVQLIVVATRCQEGWFVKRPLKPAHLLLVGREAIRKGGLNPNISQINQAVATATGQNGTGPGQCAHSCRMARHGAHLFALDRVP